MCVYISVNEIYRYIQNAVLAVLMSHIPTSTYRSLTSPCES